MKKLVIAITGASGSIYAESLLLRLNFIRTQLDACGIVITDNARLVWKEELGREFEPPAVDTELFPKIKLYKKNDFMAPFASGSAGYDAMIICPCSMGTLGRIAAGISDDLISRASDVMLKERRKLILIIRETPYSLIHINNMKTITEAGGIILPASPSFYSKPKTFTDLAGTVVDRALQLAGFELMTYQWGK